MGEFLFCSGRPGFIDARAIGIVNQVGDGDNPTFLILARTFLGLDSVFLGGESQQFLGTPLTLQIWLTEILDMIATSIVAKYGPSNFPSRAVLKTKCQTESHWVNFWTRNLISQFDGIVIGGSAHLVFVISGIRSYILDWFKKGDFL